MRLLFLLGCILTLQSFAQTNIKGTVVDATTKELLPFVNIEINNSSYGTSTDIDGRFELNLKTTVTSLQFSYVGYEPKSVTIGENKELVISLKQKTFNLNEVVINPEENPALRIIRNVIKNRKINDVEKMDYACELYNLFKINVNYDTVGMYVIEDSLINSNTTFGKTTDGNLLPIDSIQVGIKREAFVQYKNRLIPIDSVLYKSDVELFYQRPLMTLETYVEKKHIAPDRSKEKITATKMSGVKNPSFMALATKIQSFSFYKNYFEINKDRFLSPISKAGLRNYFYLIEDTIYENIDTVFVISYRPYKGKVFDGMKGVLQISSSSWAIKNVIAEPADSNAMTKITVQQLYEQDKNNKWIPKQLLGTLSFGWLQVSGTSMVGEIKTYIDSFDYQTKVRGRDVDNIAFEITPNAHKVDTTEWDKLRKIELTSKEKFAVLEQYKDSMPKGMSFDRMIDAMKYYRTGKVPLGVFSIDLDRFMRFNDFEGFRLGAGAHTNERLSKLVQVGGYFAYGFKDKQWKYGGDLNFQLSKRHEVNFNTSYTNDVVASGYPTFFEEGKSLFTVGDYATLLINQMDNIEKYEAYLSMRTLKYFKVHLFGNIQTRKANSEYLFNRATTNENISVSEGTHFISEVGVNVRWAYKETFFYDGLDKFSLGTKYPVVYAKVSMGIPTNYGNLSYTKLDLKLNKTIKLGEFGVSNVTLATGVVEGDVPYTLLSNAPGFFRQFNVSSDNVFETMRLNEFLSDKYAYAFYRHRFKAFNFSKKFNPQLEAVFNAGVGSLNNPDVHENIEFSTLENGYYESGLRIHNLLSMGLSSFGVGGYYRLGPNSFSLFKDNIAVKFVIGFNF